MEQVALLHDAVPGRQDALAEPVDPRDPTEALLLVLADAGTDPALGHEHVVDPDLAGGIAEVGFGAGRQDPPQHLVGGPLHRGDGGDAEPLVDLGAAGVVDPGHDLVDPNGSRATRAAMMFELSPLETAAKASARRTRPSPSTAWSNPIPADLVAVEIRAKASERVGVGVDDRHRVVAVLQAGGQRGAHPAASHDHDVHTITL